MLEIWLLALFQSEAFFTVHLIATHKKTLYSGDEIKRWISEYKPGVDAGEFVVGDVGYAVP